MNLFAIQKNYQTYFDLIELSNIHPDSEKRVHFTLLSLEILKTIAGEFQQFEVPWEMIINWNRETLAKSLSINEEIGVPVRCKA